MIKLPDWFKLLAPAFLLRIWTLTHERLWYDESFLALTVDPRSNFWQAVIGDNHPPGWYLIESLFTRVFGLSEFTLRLPALVCGVVCVWLIWQIAGSLFGRRIGFTAGLIAALLPAQLYTSQDCRMYAALSMCVLLMIYAGQRRNNLLFVLAGIGAVYVHNVGVIYVLAIAVVYAITRHSWRYLWTGCVIGLAWLPWASVVLAQADRVQSGFWTAPLTPGGALYPIFLTTLGWRMTQRLAVPVVIVVVMITLLSLPTLRAWLYHYAQTGLLLAGLILAPVLFLIFSLTVTNVWVFRALFPAGILVCILWAYTLHMLPGAIAGQVRILFVFALAVGVCSHYLPTKPRPDVIAWNAPIESGWRPGDLIYYLNTNDVISNGLYIDRPFAIRPNPASLIRVTQDCREAFGLAIYEQSIQSIQADRLWVSFLPTPYTPLAELNDLNQLLAAHPFQVIRRAGQAVLYRIDLK